jgi:uncharacterized protein YjbI with pentapeptide repeats
VDQIYKAILGNLTIQRCLMPTDLLAGPSCKLEGCYGARLRGGKCLAHLTRSRRRLVLLRLRRDRLINLNRVSIDQELLRDILRAAPKDEQGRASLNNIGFVHATFTEDVHFSNVIFGEWTSFTGAKFQGEANFSRATFKGEVSFSNATFEDRANFKSVTFSQGANFMAATFQQYTSFDLRTIFDGSANFSWARFQDDAWFSSAVFLQNATFHAATFEGLARFDRTTFRRSVHFSGTSFEQARLLGPMVIRNELVLTEAAFKRRVLIYASCATACCQGTQFLDGVHLQLSWAQVVLDDAALAGPSLLSGSQPSGGEVFSPIWDRMPPPPRTERWRPRLLSLRRADVAGLTISNVDLRACRFAGAHNLDKLRIEGQSLFASTPQNWRWTRRQTLAEEHHWRHVSNNGVRAPENPNSLLRRRAGATWYQADCQPPDWLFAEQLEPLQLAALYRTLRKGREDTKDEPGAADFYYGEMELRRHALVAEARRAWRGHKIGQWLPFGAEAIILWLYWLISGYGLRAWRAIAAGGIVLVLFAVLFSYGGGFDAAPTTSVQSAAPARNLATSGAPTTTNQIVDTSLGGALVFGARTAVGLSGEQQSALTRFGDMLQIGLRIIAPVLLGLALLSIRARIKR